MSSNEDTRSSAMKVWANLPALVELYDRAKRDADADPESAEARRSGGAMMAAWEAIGPHMIRTKGAALRYGMPIDPLIRKPGYLAEHTGALEEARALAEEIADRAELDHGAEAIPSEPTTVDALVTMDQAAAMVGKSKRTLRRSLDDGRLPDPDYPGGGGGAHRWRWSTLRPALLEHFQLDLPEHFPGSRIV